MRALYQQQISLGTNNSKLLVVRVIATSLANLKTGICLITPELYNGMGL